MQSSSIWKLKITEIQKKNAFGADFFFISLLKWLYFVGETSLVANICKAKLSFSSFKHINLLGTASFTGACFPVHGY